MLYPNTAESSEKEMNRAFQVEEGSINSVGVDWKMRFLFFFTFCRCKVNCWASAGSSHLAVELSAGSNRDL